MVLKLKANHISDCYNCNQGNADGTKNAGNNKNFRHKAFQKYVVGPIVLTKLCQFPRRGAVAHPGEYAEVATFPLIIMRHLLRI